MGVPVNLDEVGDCFLQSSFVIADVGNDCTGTEGTSTDEQVDSHRLSSLPPLRITTNAAASARSNSAQRVSNDSYRTAEKGKGKGTGSVSQSVPVSAVSNGDDRKVKEKYGLGSRPLFDGTKAEDLCGIEEGELQLLSRRAQAVESTDGRPIIYPQPRPAKSDAGGIGTDVGAGFGVASLAPAI